MSLPGIVTGFGLLRQRAWAQVAAIVVAMFYLMTPPVGTLIGIYTFLVFMRVNGRSII